MFKNYTKLLPNEFKKFVDVWLKKDRNNRVASKKDDDGLTPKDKIWWGYKQGKNTSEWKYFDRELRIYSDMSDQDIYRYLRESKSLSQIIEQERIVAKYGGLTLRSEDGKYSYVHSDYSGGNSVAVLGWKRTGKDGYSFIGRFERIPAHKSGPKLVSLTGGFEDDDNPGSCAQREFFEEAGIQADVSEFKYLGYIFPYKGATTKVYLFAINCANYEPTAGPGDGSNIEAQAWSAWIDLTELINSSDPILHALYLRWDLAWRRDQL